MRLRFPLVFLFYLTLYFCAVEKFPFSFFLVISITSKAHKFGTLVYVRVWYYENTEINGINVIQSITVILEKDPPLQENI